MFRKAKLSVPVNMEASSSRNERFSMNLRLRHRLEKST